MPIELAAKYASLCKTLAQEETDAALKAELLKLSEVLQRVPKEPARDFYEALQSLWLTPHAGAHGRKLSRRGRFLRQNRSISAALLAGVGAIGHGSRIRQRTAQMLLDALQTMPNAMIQTGNQGITAGYGQLFNLSGLGKDGADMTNELTWVFLEVIDEMSPILEPKPNVRLHKNSPDALLDKVVDMISSSQGAPFLLNFDERSMAGMLEEASRAHVEHLINEDNVFDYASVGCLENTMCGNDRSATVDCTRIWSKPSNLRLATGMI
jgi:formate C-acetyltransferase